MQLQTQYSIFLVNKPGVLANVCRTLADRKVNIMAMTLVDTSEHGVLRLVVADADHRKTEQVLKQLNLPQAKTDVLCIELPNEPGAMAGIAEKLGRAHININYAYATGGAKGGRTTCVLKVADVKKAEKIISPKGRAGRDNKRKLRAAPGRRR